MEKTPLHLDAFPEPWRYNPSSWKQRIYICCIALIAVIIAVYMGLYQWGIIKDVWDPVFGDQTKKVLDSDVSHELRKWLRVPDAILGAFAYLGDIIFALAGSTRRWQDRPWLVMLFGIDVIPLGVVSAILVFMQGAVVGAWCFPCLITAVISIILIFLAYDEVWSSFLYLRSVWRKSKSASLVWDTFWGKASEIAYEAGANMIKMREEKNKQKMR
ncbi:MAG TPA: vitamin K epoxide reductase family protein [Rhabdochlamydiaceae bacterium]|nr:vitamin K epoxide reductase family protein [Rhabdochlamydiaceae bacterium]